MPVQPAEPLPIESVRDLLGIARAPYRVAKDRGALAQAKELETVGKKYRLRLSSGVRPNPAPSAIAPHGSTRPKRRRGRAI